MALRLGLHRLVHQLSMPRQAALDQGASGVMASLRLLASQDVLAGITSLPGSPGRSSWAPSRGFAGQLQQPPAQRHPQRHVVYRGPWLLPFRLLVRLKVIQLSWIAALALPAHALFTEGTASVTQLATAAALLSGCGVASTTLYFFSRRYIGELSLLPGQTPGTYDSRRVLISTLDFWGNRQDAAASVEALVPPLKGKDVQLAQLAKQSFLPLDVEGDRQYLVSLRHGALLDRARLLQLLKGESISQPPT